MTKQEKQFWADYREARDTAFSILASLETLAEQNEDSIQTQAPATLEALIAQLNTAKALLPRAR